VSLLNSEVNLFKSFLQVQEKNDAKMFYFLLLEHDAAKNFRKPRRERVIRRTTEKDIDIRVGGRRRAASIGDSLTHTPIKIQPKEPEPEPEPEPSEPVPQSPGRKTQILRVNRTTSQDRFRTSKSQEPNGTNGTSGSASPKQKVSIKRVTSQDRSKMTSSPPKSPKGNASPSQSPQNSHRARVFIRGPMPDPGNFFCTNPTDLIFKQRFHLTFI
jgi:hypothetical protein